MPRSKVRLQVDSTVVSGVEIIEGEVTRVDHTLAKRCTDLTRAQGFIRRDHPSFSATGMKRVKIVYTMTRDEFIANATGKQVIEEGIGQ